MRVLILLMLSCVALRAQTVFTLQDRAFMSKSSSLLRGLQGYWRLEESSGTRYDRSPNGNHLTSNNSVGSATGKVGDCATFVSASSQSLTISDNASISLVSGTICLWTKFTTLGSMILVRKNSLANREYQIDYDNSLNRFNASVAASSTTLKEVQANNFGAAATNTWYFVAVWWNSTSVNISINNGTANSTSGSNIGRDGTSTLCFGKIEDNTAFLNGTLDEVGFWNRVLSASEITQLYRSGLGVTYPRFSMRDNLDDFDFDTWQPLYDRPKPFPTIMAFVNRREPEPFLTLCD